MERTTSTPSTTLLFTGRGSELFMIKLLNWVLTGLTFGLYYPWAKVKTLKYLYSKVELNESPFLFSGTGKEIFKGFIKLFVFAVVLYGSFMYAQLTHNVMLAIVSGLGILIGLIILIPLALHGALRYRLSRTSWRGILMGYRGSRSHLCLQYYLQTLLTIITFGIYYAWMLNKLRTYIIGNIRFGALRFGYTGEGFELFIIRLKGSILTFLTLGIYYFWYQKESINYFINSTYIEQDGNRQYLKGNINGGSYFAFSIINLFITIFTLGLGLPWVTIRTFNFILENVELPSGIDWDRIEQTEDEYLDAVGEDIVDYLDIDII